jgi:hypothetical protein
MVASITYTCPEPFCPATAGKKAAAAFVATNVTARITLPPNLPLSKGNLTIDLGVETGQSSSGSSRRHNSKE